MRCAAFLGLALKRLPVFFREDVALHSPSLARVVVDSCQQANAFFGGDMKSAELLVSLLFTQRYGYHLLDDAEVDRLCKTYGAVDDLLVFVTDAEASFQSLTLQRAEQTTLGPAFEDPFRPLIESAALTCGRRPYLRITSANPSRKMIRFVIPPSIAMVALISLAEGTKILNSAGHSSWATCERLTAIAIGAFMRVACRKRVASLPTKALFADFFEDPYFEDSSGPLVALIPPALWRG